MVAPAHWWCPDYGVTLGPEVAAVATLAGFAPDAEQQLLLDAAFAIDPVTAKSVAFEVVVIAPRQNLKTGFQKQYALGQLFVRREPLVVWSAHEFGTAHEALEDVEALISGSDWLRRQVKLTARGEVAKHGAVPVIELEPQGSESRGPRLIFKTRTSGGGRGLSGRKVLLDEGYALQAGQVGALMPIMLAQPDPQVVVGSSACRPESSVLWDMVQRGRAGGEPRMVFAEWCTPSPEVACDRGEKCMHARNTPGCGCDKPEVIRLGHSAIARGRVLLQSVLDLRASMPPEEYAREVMGWHDQVLADGEPAVPYEAWLALTDDDALHAPADIRHFGVEVDQDRSMASIGAAGLRDDGRMHVELLRRARGTKWTVEYARQVAAARSGAVWVIDGGGPAADLIPDFEAAGLVVVTAGFGDAAASAAGMVDGVREAVIVHGPDDVLADAARASRKRYRGDGAFTLGRRASTEDITPLIACAFAAWAADVPKRAPEVWSLQEMVARIRAENAAAGSDAPESVPSAVVVRPDGSRFVPIR